MDNNWSFASYDDTDLQEPSNAIWTDEHHEPVVQAFDADRVVERDECRGPRFRASSHCL